MGNARWSQADWSQHAQRSQTKTQDQLFTQDRIHPDLDPSKIKVRECFDSEANPSATPIVIGCDETGSMGILAETIIKSGLGKIMKSIYDHKPVPDPQIACMGLGDAYSDKAPLQVTQFEASVDPLVKQVAQIWLEHHGGGNGGESYGLAWWFATYKTTCDAILKRKRKGYLFTIGDEAPHAVLTKDQIIRVCGVGCERDVPITELLAITKEFWDVFHLIVKPVADQPVIQKWTALLNERAILVDDHEKIAEVITAVIRLLEGQRDVTADYEPGTALVVQRATAGLQTA